MCAQLTLLLLVVGQGLPRKPTDVPEYLYIPQGFTRQLTLDGGTPPIAYDVDGCVLSGASKR